MKGLGIPVDDPFTRLFPPGVLAPSIKVAPLSCETADGFIDREALTLMWRKAVAQRKRRDVALARWISASTPSFSQLAANTQPANPAAQSGVSPHGAMGNAQDVSILGAQTQPTEPNGNNSYSLFDAIEQGSDASHPESELRNAYVALGAAFGELNPKDQEATKIFVKIQIGILMQLFINLPPQFNNQKPWLAAVVEDFIRPLANSLDERARGVPISNSGWAEYFNALDAGKFNYFFPSLSDLESAKAMALDHIDNDLKRALEKNGVGTDEMWDYLGTVVKDQTEAVLQSNVEEDAMKAAGIFDPDDDVSKIRNRMREKVKASKRKSN